MTTPFNTRRALFRAAATALLAGIVLAACGTPAAADLAASTRYS